MTKKFLWAYWLLTIAVGILILWRFDMWGAGFFPLIGIGAIAGIVAFIITTKILKISLRNP